jgi:uncharacterized protein (DUF427 family)
MQATWNGVVIAQSDATVTVEGNAYFPADSLQASCFRPSSHRSSCGWKGEAHYYDVVVDGQRESQRCLVLSRSQACRR